MLTWLTLLLLFVKYCQFHSTVRRILIFMLALTSVYLAKSVLNYNKKQIDASVKERPQTLLSWFPGPAAVGQGARGLGYKPYLFPRKKFVSMFYAINVFNTIYYFKPTNFNCA